MTQFLVGDPTLLLNQLLATVLEVCDVDAAAVIFGERIGRQTELVWAASTGYFAESLRGRLLWKYAIQNTLDEGRPGILHCSGSGLETEAPSARECLILPFGGELANRGAIILSTECTKRLLDPTDERIVRSFTGHAKLAWEKRNLQLRSARGFVSAARLANQLAHQINNPLQALMNSLHLIAADGDDSPHLSSARKQAGRISLVVKSTLEISACKDPWA